MTFVCAQKNATRVWGYGGCLKVRLATEGLHMTKRERMQFDASTINRRKGLACLRQGGSTHLANGWGHVCWTLRKFTSISLLFDQLYVDFMYVWHTQHTAGQWLAYGWALAGRRRLADGWPAIGRQPAAPSLQLGCCGVKFLAVISHTAL